MTIEEELHRAIIKCRHSFKFKKPVSTNFYHSEFGWVLKDGKPTESARAFIDKMNETKDKDHGTKIIVANRGISRVVQANTRAKF